MTVIPVTNFKPYDPVWITLKTQHSLLVIIIMLTRQVTDLTYLTVLWQVYKEKNKR